MKKKIDNVSFPFFHFYLVSEQNFDSMKIVTNNYCIVHLNHYDQ